MADLSTLIRLHKHELDEKRQALAQLYTSMDGLEFHRRKLEEDFEREKEEARKSEDIQFTLSRYVEQVHNKREELKGLKAQLEKRIEQAKDSMMETFSELKKFEMTQAERERLEAEERALRESKEMDAIGIEGFRRKGKD